MAKNILRRTIKALSLKRIDEGSVGFITKEEEGIWYNALGEKEVLEEMTKNIIAKGNTIEFEYNNGVVGSITLIEKAKEQEGSIDDLTTFEDLLRDAHTKFPDKFSIRTKLIENDWEKKRAIFKARIEVITDKTAITFEAYGDATEDNCGELVKKHYVRMAETRAIARALRWATNNAKAAREETEHSGIRQEMDKVIKKEEEPKQ